MHSKYIREMVQALVSAGVVVSDEAVTQQVLEQYWSDQIAMVYTIADVRQALGEDDSSWCSIADECAIAVLKKAHEEGSTKYGVNWSALYRAAEELGFV